jgi:hypothetical protein
LAVLLLGLAAPVLAANPHFIWVKASADEDANLIVEFKEAGLGNNQLVQIEARADAVAAYACQNKGGKFPHAANKHLVAEPVSAAGEFESGKNGNVTDSITVSPPEADAPPDFCPGKQHLELVGVRYENIQACDVTDAGNEFCEPAELPIEPDEEPVLEILLYHLKFDPWNE